VFGISMLSEERRTIFLHAIERTDDEPIQASIVETSTRIPPSHNLRLKKSGSQGPQQLN
jgi:hypothetical protein